MTNPFALLNDPSGGRQAQAVEEISSLVLKEPFSKSAYRAVRKLRRMDCDGARAVLSRYREAWGAPDLDLPLDEKEIFEAYAFFRLSLPYLDGVGSVVDCCAGNGLSGLLWALDGKRVTLVDKVENGNYKKLYAHLSGKTRLDAEYVLADIREQMPQADAYISMHACGTLTDAVLEAAILARKPFAVVPCCHDHYSRLSDDLLSAFADKADAIDALRIAHAQDQGYRAVVRQLPAYITGKNRVLIGLP